MWSRHEMYSCYFRKHSIFNELSRIQITNPARLYVQFTLSNNEDLLLLVTQLCLTVCNPMNSSPSGSPTMEFSKQEYWSGLPFPSPGDLPNPGIEPGLSALQADSLPVEPPGKSKYKIYFIYIYILHIYIKLYNLYYLYKYIYIYTKYKIRNILILSLLILLNIMDILL